LGLLDFLEPFSAPDKKFWKKGVGETDRLTAPGERFSAEFCPALADSSRHKTLEKPAGFSLPDQSLVPLKSRPGLRPSRVSFASLRQLTTR